MYLWDIGDREERGESATDTVQQQLPGHDGEVACVAWSPDGRWLASGSGGCGGGELFVWEVQSRECLQALVGQPALVSAVTWDQSGNQLISGGSDGRLCWWEVHSGKCLLERQAHEGRIWSLKQSPNGLCLASSGDDSTIQLWELKRAQLVRTLRSLPDTLFL